MTTSYRRITLLAGASITAIGLASPALAAPHDGLPQGTYNHPDSPSVTNTPGVDVTDTLEICLVVDEPCFFGTVGSPTATTSQVIVQEASGDDINIDITNAGSAEIGAFAYATGGAANAQATLKSGIYQTAAGTGNVSADVDNNGQLLIDANAIASGSDATANAYLTNGIYQKATSTDGNVQLTLTNDDELTVEALATAIGTDAFAYACATLNHAVFQSAVAGSGYASNVVANNGTMTLGAVANAVGYGTSLAFHATATADADQVIQQYASATGEFGASNSVSNAGTLNIDARAAASGSGLAFANAYLSQAIVQTANAVDGLASNVVSNTADGVIDVGAYASALATDGFASADATISNAIQQSATTTGAGYATNTISNAGALNIHANATATADTEAFANATITNGIRQHAYASGSGYATNLVDNSGTLNITANANAVAVSGTGQASASR